MAFILTVFLSLWVKINFIVSIVMATKMTWLGVSRTHLSSPCRIKSILVTRKQENHVPKSV